MIRIYLDACCLNRPFDDQTQARIRLEAEAVLIILTQCQMGDWEWIGSDRLLRRAAARAAELHVRVANPLTWLREVSET